MQACASQKSSDLFLKRLLIATRLRSRFPWCCFAFTEAEGKAPEAENASAVSRDTLGPIMPRQGPIQSASLATPSHRDRALQSIEWLF